MRQCDHCPQCCMLFLRACDISSLTAGEKWMLSSLSRKCQYCRANPAQTSVSNLKLKHRTEHKFSKTENDPRTHPNKKKIDDRLKNNKTTHILYIPPLPGVTYPGAAALTKAPLARAALPLPLATWAATAEAAAAAARAPLVWTQHIFMMHRNRAWKHTRTLIVHKPVSAQAHWQNEWKTGDLTTVKYWSD